ncbi:MAG: PCRF domain-containing protein [Actinobacteria bacterium]|nr:PCRF domain-containing protein [Actinomycetota bacterium]
MTEPTDPYSLTAELRKRLDEARVFLDLEGKATELDALREKVASPDLWEDPDEARNVSRRLARYQALFEKVNGLESRIDDAEVLVNISNDSWYGRSAARTGFSSM